MMTGPEQGSWAVLLTGTELPASSIGAKAAMLDRLIALGVRTPASAAVTTDAYRAFVAESGLEPKLDQLRTEPLPPISEHLAAREHIDAAFLDRPMPPGMADTIRRTADAVAGGGLLAVRSSATAEDLRSASFAGQYTTLLDVQPEDVANAVRSCWASLWHPTVRAYRRFHSIDEREIAMGVLLMPMLQPTHAGVVFTEAPEDSRLVRIEVVEGLGESLVSGARTPEVVAVERSALDTSIQSSPPCANWCRRRSSSSMSSIRPWISSGRSTKARPCSSRPGQSQR